MKLREHKIVLNGERVELRPLTENDWDILLRWNNDPEVLYYAEGDDISSSSLDRVQGIYRGVSQTAFCFIIEYKEAPIGEGWLQEMNLPRILERYPNADCYRIDLLIGEKTCWGMGLGTEVIELLSKFAFQEVGADYVFGCDVADYNVASRKAFLKAGYIVEAQVKEPEGRKAKYSYDLVLIPDAT